MRSAILAALLFCQVALAQPPQIADGPFRGDLESLRQYQCPEWFRDAKFGIWAHWGPQAVPMDGDWYAQRMYEPGHRQYKHHLETYGHPSEFGYKDIIPLWKAEKWDPDRLMALYKKAGAKYFVSMGSHHDNFYLWNSKLHKWNAVQHGPEARRGRRLAEGGQEARPAVRRLRAPRRQLHLVPAQPRRGQGRAPRPACPTTAPTRSTRTSTTSRPSPATRAGTARIPRWQQQWFERIKELVDNYQPDLLYTDGGVPFGNEVGLQPDRPPLQRRRRAPRRQARGGLHLQAAVRGPLGRGPRTRRDARHQPRPVADRHLDRRLVLQPQLEVPPGELDHPHARGHRQQERQPAAQRRAASRRLARSRSRADAASRWPTGSPIHGEAIYGTRPWLVYGEGARRRPRAGTSRRTSPTPPRTSASPPRAPTLYAIALGWPEDGQLLVRSLATPAGEVETVSLLGSRRQARVEADRRRARRDRARAAGFAVHLRPEDHRQGPQAGSGSRDRHPGIPGCPGQLHLEPDDAALSGEQIKLETQGGQPNIGFWDRADESVAWTLDVKQPGEFTVTASCRNGPCQRRIRP